MVARDRESLAAALKPVAFFSILTDEELDEVIEAGQVERCDANQTVLREGDPADKLYVILDGRVRVHRRDDQGNAMNLWMIGSGTYFGEVAFFDGGTRSATISTVGPCELFTLGREPFIALCLKYRQLLVAVLASLAGKLRGSDQIFLRAMLEKQKLHAEMEIARHRSIAEMVVGLAHEINTPLGIINNAASVITERLSGDLAARLPPDRELQLVVEDVLDASQLIERNALRVDKLVQSFKHISANQITERQETVDLPSLVHEIVDLFKLNARRAQLRISVQNLIAGERAWTGYPGALSQVLLNLLSNVERYAYPQGGGEVELLITADDTPRGRRFVLAVHDFGAGIAPENLAQIFDPFFTTGRGKGGTGLGLSIVYNIVTSLLNGTITAVSEPGKGTTFTLSMPQIVRRDQRA